MSTDDCFCSPSTDCPNISAELTLFNKEVYAWTNTTIPNELPYGTPGWPTPGSPYRLNTDSGAEIYPEIFFEGTGEIIETPFSGCAIFDKYKLHYRVNDYTIVKANGELELNDFAYFGNLEILGESFDVRLSYIGRTASLTKPDEAVLKYPYYGKVYGKDVNLPEGTAIGKNINNDWTLRLPFNKGGIYTDTTHYPIEIGYARKTILPFDYCIPTYIRGVVKQSAQPHAFFIYSDGTPTPPFPYTTVLTIQGVGDIDTTTITTTHYNFNSALTVADGIMARVFVFGSYLITVENPITKEGPYDQNLGPTTATISRGIVKVSNLGMPGFSSKTINTDIGQSRVGLPKAFYKNPIWELDFDTFEIEVQVISSAEIKIAYERVPELSNSLYFPVTRIENIVLGTLKNTFTKQILKADVTGAQRIRSYLQHSYISNNVDPYQMDFNYARLGYHGINQTTPVAGQQKRYNVTGLPNNTYTAIVAEFGASIIAPVVNLTIEEKCILRGSVIETKVIKNGSHCKYFGYNLNKNLAPHLEGDEPNIPLALGNPMPVNDGQGVGIATWTQDVQSTIVGSCPSTPFPSNYRQLPRVYYLPSGPVYFYGVGPLPTEYTNIVQGIPTVKSVKIEGIKIRWTGDWQ